MSNNIYDSSNTGLILSFIPAAPQDKYFQSAKHSYFPTAAPQPKPYEKETGEFSARTRPREIPVL